MWLFYFVGLLCLVAFPALLFFFSGRFLLGSAGSIQKLFKGRTIARQLAASNQKETALVSASRSGTAVLDDILMTRAGPFTVDHTFFAHDLDVFVRAQATIVDLRGEKMRFPWSREERSRANHVVKVSLVVNARGVLPPTISLHADPKSGEVSFGDSALYAAFVTGKLDDALREGDRLSFSECCVIVESPFAGREGRVPQLVEALAHAARRLLDATSDGRPDVGRLLLENVLSDDSPAVRARSIDGILGWVEDDEIRESAIVAALEDDAPEVRLAAARNLGERGFAVAEVIARDEAAVDGLRQRALRFLMRRFEPDLVVPVLRDALEAENEVVVQLAVRRLGELALIDAIPWLATLAERASAETAVVIANALGAIGDPSSELTLIALYEKHFDEVKVAAADALGTLGTADAVSHLLPAAESTRVPTELRVAAATAVKLIQSRVRGKAGSLSVIIAHKETGHVSLTAGGRGALSDPVADKTDQIELSK